MYHIIWVIGLLASVTWSAYAQTKTLNDASSQQVFSQSNAAAAKLDPNILKVSAETFADAQDLIYDHSYSEASLLKFHKTLINIPSTTGSEAAVGHFLHIWLQEHGFAVELQPVGPLDAISEVQGGTTIEYPKTRENKHHKPSKRFNVFAYPPGKRQTSLLITSHMDTVPPYYPYHLQQNASSSFISGRGSVDAKGCIVTQLYAYLRLLADQMIPPDSASFLFVVGEEVTGDGMQTANDLNLHWDTVIFGEPTENRLANGHKGILLFELSTHGKGGHSGYPELATSAIDKLLPALTALQSLHLPSSTHFGNSTLNIGTISAGVAANVIATDAHATIAIRLAGTEPPEKTQETLKRTIHAINPEISIRFYGHPHGPVSIDADIPGLADSARTVNYFTDIPNLHGAHKRYLFGPGSILVAHSDHEGLNAGELSWGVEGYRIIIAHVL